MKIIAQQTLEGQYTVSLVDHGMDSLPRYQIRYGAEHKWFNMERAARSYYRGCCTHQQDCAGWRD